MTIKDLMSIDISIWEMTIEYHGTKRNSKYGYVFEDDSLEGLFDNNLQSYTFEIKDNDVLDEIINVFGDLEIRKIIPRDDELTIYCSTKEVR